MEDYSELEGKVIDFIHDNGELVKCKIVGCEYDIGITIVNAKDKEDYLLCVIGPSSSLGEAVVDFRGYRKCFEYYIEQIKNGSIDIAAAILHTAYRNRGSKPDINNCAFGQ